MLHPKLFHRATYLVLCAAIMLVSACGAKQLSETKSGFNNISGTYRYVGVGSYTPVISSDMYPNPLIDMSDIAKPSDVIIKQRGTEFQVTYSSRANGSKPVSKTINLNDLSNGNLNKLNSEKVIWHNGVLKTTKRIPIKGPKILPLPGRHYSGTRILKSENGNLYIISFFKEKGLFFSDVFEDDVVFERIE